MADAKRGRGRPPFVPTPEQRRRVEVLAGSGVPHEQIVKLIINPATNKAVSWQAFYKHFRAELDEGYAKVHALMVSTVVKAAQSGNVSAAMFWLKSRAGWRERVALTGEDGGAVKVDSSVEHDATAEVRAILDQLATSKAGGFVGAGEVAGDGAAEPDHSAG